MSVVPVTSLEQFHSIIKSERPSVFDFWATWCGPCRIIGPIFEKFSAVYNKDIDFYKVDVDEQPDIAQEVGIRAMPTFSTFKLGEQMDSIMGANPGGLEACLCNFAYYLFC
ncbi:thioredoxin [Hysterangium stoloniferum]|nr:thioredoxin [Hysterangium stoloniferum]